MEPITRNYPAIQQTLNNSTGWIGHLPGENKEIVRGQTFVAEQEGDLDAIEIFPNMVSGNGRVHMSLHSFDAIENKWGPALDSAVVDIDASDAGKWLAFNMHGQHLDRGKTYGFRMESDNGCVGVAEAVWSAGQPFQPKGQEWAFVGNADEGDAYSYFSLAYKVDLRA